MPHFRFTHEVIELTDGRCYCLTCDEVVPDRYLDGRREAAESVAPSSSRRPAAGD